MNSLGIRREVVKSIIMWVAPCLLLLVGCVLFLYYRAPNNAASSTVTFASGSPHAVPTTLPTSNPQSAPPAATNSSVSSSSGPSKQDVGVLDPVIYEMRKSVLEDMEKDEKLRLARYELELRKDMASGWNPPWKGLDIKLTDEELKKMPTKDLGAYLWSTGIHARTLILCPESNLALRRLEVCYRGYAELFSRPDLLDAILAGINGAALLSHDKTDQQNLSIVMALTSLPQTYGYPPIRDRIAGHEREVIRAHIAALRSIRNFVGAAYESNALTSVRISPRSSIVLSESALALGERLSPEKAKSARQTLAQFRFQDGKDYNDLVNYIDQAIAALQAIAAQ